MNASKYLINDNVGLIFQFKMLEFMMLMHYKFKCAKE